MLKWLIKPIPTAIISWLSQERAPQEFPLSNFEIMRHEIRPCDVLLVEGRSRVTDVIKVITQSSWSHAALYIGRLHDIEDPIARKRIQMYYDGQPDTQLIIESQLGYGTIVRPLNTYDRDHLRICRPREITYKDSQKVIRFAVSRLGTDYDVRQIFDLLRYLFPWAVMPRRWRSSLFNYMPGKSLRTVCSTMIAEAFSYIQYPILPLIKKSSDHGIQLFRRNPKVCTPRDFDHSPYFDIIKYPYMEFNESARYRLMPWKGNIGLSGDESGVYIEDEKIPWPEDLSKSTEVESPSKLEDNIDEKNNSSGEDQNQKNS